MMKQEDDGSSEQPLTILSPPDKLPGSKPGRGRPRKRDVVEATKTPRQAAKKSKVVVDEDSANNTRASSTPGRKKRGLSKSTGKNDASKDSGKARTRGTGLVNMVSKKPGTKAGMAGVAQNDSYSYSDLFMEDDDDEGDDQNMDENAEDDDSEYAPSDEEVGRRISNATRRRKGVSAGTRRQSRSKPVTSQADGSTDEDEAGESESDYDEDDEDEILEEQSLLLNSNADSNAVPLFTDDSRPIPKDIYDFDNQSILSDKQLAKQRSSQSGVPRVSTRAGIGRSAGAVTGRTTRASSRVSRALRNMGTSWGSNIYSAIAAVLKTRADLDAYSSFLKSDFLNSNFDQFLASICKPSNQHANLFYGSSASLQGLMSRVSDYDKVVELLHAFVAHPYEELQHRITYLLPIIHQPVFGTSYATPVNCALNGLAETIDHDLVIKPAYVLHQEVNLLAMRNETMNEFGISSAQYHFVTGAGNIGRYMPDARQLIVPSDFYDKLNEMVSLPPDRVYEIALSKVHSAQEDADIDISPLEPPNLQRILLAVDENFVLLSVALLDTWNRSDVPHKRPQPPIEVVAANPDGLLNEADANPATDGYTLSIEEQVKDVLDNVLDWVALQSDPKHVTSISKRMARTDCSQLTGVYFMDAFVVKPNGRRDCLLLVAHTGGCHPPLPAFNADNEISRVFLLLDEARFQLERHGFAPDVPISLDGVHLADPEELMDDKSLLVVPDLLFDTLRKVVLRELISSSGTASAAAAVVSAKDLMASMTGGSANVVHCMKFAILDRVRRFPLAVAFDSPVRLALQVSTDEEGLHAFGASASSRFDQITPTELKASESGFKPTTAEYRLVAMNGLIFGLQIDDERVVRRLLEVVPARFDLIFPHKGRLPACAQSAIAAHTSCPANCRIVNDETGSSTVLPALLYPHFEYQSLTNVIANFSNHLANLLFALPIEISLYDIVFRLAQKHMPELLVRQHIEAAEAAAFAEAAANPHAPPPAPVPLPDYWGVCCICSKELRSPNGLLDHEMRHIGLFRFRCAVHNQCFADRQSWQAHLSDYHGPNRASTLPLPRPSILNQNDATSEPEEDEDETDAAINGSRGLLVGLSQVFNTGALVSRMEAPQCEKCVDYFMTAEMLAQHLDFCDGVSFSVRTPLPKSSAAQKSVSLDDSSSTLDLDGTMDNAEMKSSTGTCICGMCGTQLSSRERVLRHFETHHLQCIMCSKSLRSLEELSNHYYHDHISKIESNNVAPNDEEEPLNKTDATEECDQSTDQADTVNSQQSQSKLLQKLMACDICSNFYGTKYNYFYHQWAEHGVAHPVVGSQDRVPMQLPRPGREKSEKDEYVTLGLRRMRCKFCGLVVRVTGKDYIAHLSEKHQVMADPDVICRICAELFESPEGLSAHLGEIHAVTGEFTNAGVQTIYRCTHCEYWGFNRALLKHCRDIHSDNNPEIYECIHCYERFTDKRFWKTHMDKHNEGYAHRCPECGRAFRLRPSLLHHMRTHHGEDQGPSSCEFCGITYPKQSSLRYHIFRMHNKELAHECCMCQRRFRLETELRRHVKEMHSGAVRCEICHKVCTNLRCYAQHRQKHFRTRIYQCTDCQTTFKSKLAMKRHIRVEHLQLGPEKFECQICGKIVTQIGMHMLIHKEARFECEYCGKKFTKAAYYNEHLRIHRGEQPFECHICHKRFNKKSNLNVHVRFHEKHRDIDGNYLELKPRGRISTMFGDALLSPNDRAARQAARSQNSQYANKVDASAGPDLPGAFNCIGPAGAAADAVARLVEESGDNCFDEEMQDPLFTKFLAPFPVDNGQPVSLGGTFDPKSRLV